MAILQLANRALITPHLYPDTVGTAPPIEVCSLIDEIRRRNLIRNRSLFETLAEVTRRLNAAQIRPVLLKGCATWVNDGGELSPDSDRMVSDIDLIVPASQSNAAVSVLSSIDFEVLEDHRSEDDHVIAILGRDRDAGTIDLHCRAPCPVGIPELDNLHEHTRSVRIEGADAFVLRAELHLLVMALHDLVHDAYYWLGDFNLRHLLDTKRLLERDDFDWDFLDRVCADGFIRAMTELQLRCAHELVGADVPPRFLSSLSAHAHYRRMRLQHDMAWLRPPLAWFGHLIKWRESSVRARVEATV